MADKLRRNQALRIAINRLWRRCADDSGATATEYLMIMVFVVMPIAAMVPAFLSMIKIYGTRMTSLMGLPFP